MSRPSSPILAWCLSLSLALAVPQSSLPADESGGAESRADATDSASEYGAVQIFPTRVELRGTRDRQQMVVTAFDQTGAPRDWTRNVHITSDNPTVAEVEDAVVYPRSNGEAEIVVEWEGEQRTISVQVRDMQREDRVAFESEVLVALSKQGCNAGACHGSPSGKGMFRLSLRAFDPPLDELTLTREEFGRRINPVEPERSLLLLKPMMQVHHGGGKRLRADDAAYAILREWIAAGAQLDPPETPRCVRLEVFPNERRVLPLDHGQQQLCVIAHFADGACRDVTHLATYETAHADIGRVDENGLVTPLARGETVILVRFLEHIESVPFMFTEKVAGFAWQAPPANNYVDELVNAKLEQLQFQPSETCNDSEFVRRVYLDVIGVLPSVEETRSFLADTNVDKRARLINAMLEREEFAKFWSLKWGDLLMLTQERLGDVGIYKYHRWLEEALRSNMPYDEFARRLISASGSTLANPPANFYRAANDMEVAVETISQVFLGMRLQCAKCHNHPFERWTQDNYYALGAFFNRIERRATERPGEMFVWTANVGEVRQPRTGKLMQPWLPGEHLAELTDVDGDRRQPFVEWLVHPDNPYFAKMEVNRIWAQLFARGIVDPIDDFRESNPPTHPDVLEALSTDFVKHGFDRKHLLRTILNSRTYQASYRPHAFNREDHLYFSHQQPRFLSAEQLFDAINHTLGLEARIGALPGDVKATQLPSPDIAQEGFLQVFGQPARTTACACERTNDSNLGMAIELFNGASLFDKLRDPKNRFRRSLAAGRSIEEVVDEIYLAALCRPASEFEQQAATEHCAQHTDVALAFEDICWALLNTDEFLFQH